MAEFKLSRLRVSWGGPWTTATTYARDTVVQYNGKTYLCLAPHTSGTFLTDLASAYWGLQIDGKTWLGPYTPGNNYVPGNLVTYGGTVYVCTVGIVSAPTVLNLSNWATYVQTNKWNNAWTPATNYGVGDTVRYGGIVYTCTTQHTSAATTALGLEANQSSWTILFSGINYTGAWVSGARYKLNDVARVGAELFICTTYNSDATFTPSRWTLWMPGMEFASTWLIGSTYQQGDIVLYGGYSYISNISNNTGYNPTTDAVNWSIVTSGFTISGEWNNLTTYPVGAIVTRDGRSFSANTNSVGQDPSQNYNTANYKAAGSSGTTVVVTSATGLSAGDFVIGVGFNYGQYISAINTVTNTLTLNAAPNAALTDNQSLTFVGVNTTYWTLLIPGAYFRGAWNVSNSYVVGDTVVWRNTTYYALQGSNGQQPDPTNTYWTVYIKHFQKNASGIAGDITYYSTGTVPQYAALAIGTTSYVLRVTTNSPAWSYINKIPNVYYVAPNGVDTVGTAGPTNYNIINSGNSSYIINGNANPTLTLLAGQTYTFTINAIGHPFWITTSASAYNAGTIYANGITSNGLQSGTITFTVPIGAPSVLYYHCQYHSSMAGQINIITGASSNYGTSWDQPWATIAFACQQVGNGLAYIAASATLETNREFMVQEMYYWMLSQKTSQIAPFTTASIFDQTKTLRDARYVVDAIAYDIARGGNSQIVASTLSYFAYGSTNSLYSSTVTAEIAFFIAGLNQLLTLMQGVIGGQVQSPTYQLQNGVVNPVTYTTPTGYTYQAAANTAATSLMGILTTALTNQTTAQVPSPNSGLTATIFVKTGTYTESLPITIPENVALVGDELRGVVVQPANVINTVITATSSTTNLLTAASTVNMTDGAPIQLVASVNSALVATTLGGLTAGKTYYIVGPSVTSTQFGITSIVTSFTAVASTNRTVANNAATGAVFNVTKTTTGGYAISINIGGSNYTIGDQVTILGSSVQGVSTANDISINVTSVSAGTINGFSFGGSSAAPTTNVVVSNPAATGASFVVIRNGAGFTVTLSNSGTNYNNGDTLKILGSSIGGSSPLNDITITVATTSNGNIVTFTSTGSSLLALTTSTGSNLVYGGGALSNMFYMRNGSGLRNMTLNGLLGTLTAPDAYLLSRPTGGAYVSLDPGTGPNDTSAWIFRKSPYVQNVTTFGTGCVGYKVDGTLHAGGNKSIVTNDFTQVLSDGIGIWTTGPGALTEAVSVFSYYAYSGYLAEAGGKIRATNGNSSYGTYGVVAVGYDTSETPITGNIFNQSTQVQATVQSTLTGSAQLLKLAYLNAGSNYVQPTTNLLNYSNAFTTSPWTNDGNTTLAKNNIAPTGLSEAWILTGTSGTASTGYIQQATTISPSGTTNYTISMYVYQGTAPSVDLSAIFSGSSTVTSNINYVFSTNTITATSSGGGLLPVNYGAAKTLVTGWYRIWMSIYDTNGANTTLTYRFYAKGLAAGNTGNYSIVYGAQTEISTASYIPSFYLETQNNRYTAFAYFEITGAGTNVNVIGDETRSGSVFNARITDPGTGAGGAGYLTASNFAQASTSTTLSLSLNDANSALAYIGMRAFVTAGTGTGQYGYISSYNATTKVAQILQESFDVITVASTTSGTNIIGLSVGTDYSKMYINQPVQFLPKYFSTAINNTNLATMSCTSATGGTINTLIVTSTAQLAVNMQIVFSGTTFTQITSGYVYYVYSINPVINGVGTTNTIQIASTLGGSPVQLTSGTGSLTLNYPSYSSYINAGSTTNMSPGLPIQFTGTTAGGLATSTVYYINDVIDSTNFTVSVTQVTVTATSSSSSNNTINVGSTGQIVPLNPIVFTGAVFGGVVSGQKYYVSNIVDGQTIQISNSLTTQTITAVDGSSYITTSSVAGFILGNPIKFYGNTFGGIVTETTYYILQTFPGTNQFSVTGTVGGSQAVSLTVATGSMTLRTCTSTNAIATATGTMNGLSSGLKLSLFLSYNNSLTATFSTQLFGGVSQGVTYYVKTFTPGSNQMTVVTTSGGSTSPTLSTSTGTMAMGAAGWDHIVPGTPILTLDTSSVYYIEPRTTFADPAFSQNNSYTVLSAGAGNSWAAIGYGLNYFIALPNTGTAAAGSADSNNWTSLTMPASLSWTGIAYGNGYWVAVASGSSTAYVSKNNGVSWTVTTLPSGTAWNSITYGNGIFVVTSSNTATAVSTNFGATWSSGTMTNIGAGSVVYGQSTFVYVSAAGTNYNTSTNGITWNAYATLSANSGTSIAYGNGRFVTVSSAGAASQYSFDAITWYSSNTTLTATNIVYGQGIFLAFGTTGTAYISDGGHAWTTKTIASYTSTPVAVFGYSNTNTGVFATLYGQNSGNYFSAGVRAKGRAVVSSGIMGAVSMFEPGSGYASSPAVTFTDPNVTTQAVVLSRIGNGALGSPTFANKGSGYSTTSTSVIVTGNGYADQFQTGYNIIMNNISSLPSPGCDLVIAGNPTIYKVTSATAVYGTVAPNIQAVIGINPFMTTALSPTNASAITIRTKYSQCRLTNHDFLNIGYGNAISSNYPGIPSAGYTAVANNQAVEANYGRCFYTASDQDGNFKVGTLFGVQQSTGIITLSTSQFGITGLSQLALGGISVGGSSVSVTQFSTDPTFVANSDNILSTQKAIKSYLSSRLSAGSSNTVTTTAQAGNLVFGGSTIAPATVGTSNKVNVKVSFQGQLAGIDGNFSALEYFARHFNHRSSIF